MRWRRRSWSRSGVRRRNRPSRAGAQVPPRLRVSREESRAEPGAGLGRWRAGEDGAGGVLAEGVEGVALGEPALDRYELAPRVALEADEDKARVQEAVRVGAGVVGVGA